MNTLRSDGNTIHVDHDDQTLIAEIRCRGQEPFILTLPLSAAHLLREALSITPPSPGRILGHLLDDRPALTTWTFEIPGPDHPLSPAPGEEVWADPYESWHTDMATPEPTTTEGEPMNPWTCTITDNEADGHVNLNLSRQANASDLGDVVDDPKFAAMVTVLGGIVGEEVTYYTGLPDSLAEDVKPLMIPLDVLDAIVDARLRDLGQPTGLDTVIVNQQAPTVAIDPFVREVLDLERRRVNHALGIATQTDDDAPF